MKLKRFIVLLLIISIVLGNSIDTMAATNISKNTVIASGTRTDYDNYEWVLYENGLLEITGEDSLYFSYSSYRPWDSYENSIKEVKISEGITAVGKYSFYGCSNLEKISLPSSIESIGESAFRGCKNLVEISVPNSVYRIDDLAFADCSSLEMVKLSNILETLGGISYSDPSGNHGVFRNCTNLRTVEIPGTVTTFGEATFLKCTNLETCILNEGISYIGDSCFSGCSNLKKIEIPSTLTSISWGAFSGCKSLTNIYLPEGLRSVGNYAFNGCSSLTDISFPSSIESLGTDSGTGLVYTFLNCDNLENINVAEGSTAFKSIEGILYDKKATILYYCPEKNSIRNITIPDTVQQIGHHAFYNCKNLESIEIPDGLSKIGEEAWYAGETFTGCENLQSVKIPKSILFIEADAFIDSSKVIFYGEEGSYANKYANKNNIPFVGLKSVSSVTKISGTINHYYGVNSYKNTPAGDIYDDSIAFVKAMDDYLTELKKATQKDSQTINKTSKSSAQLLREADEATNDKIITMDATIPDAAMNSVYETLAQYLDTYVETGVSLGKIDMSASTIEISAGIVNKIRNNLDSLDFTRKIGKYTVTFKILKFMGAYTGSVTVQGNGRYYTGIIVSGSKETAKVLTTYMNDMSKWAEDALYQSLKSIFTELADITGISDYTKKEIKELLKDKVKLLQDKGYGDLLKYWQEMRDGYDICQKIVAAKDAANLTEALNNVESVYNKIKKLNYSDETVSNRTVSTAMNKLNSAKDKLAQSLYYYIYDKNNENGGNNNWWSNTWKSFKSIFVQCPVDFVVYDNNGNELGKVEDTETTYTSDIHINIDGDVKTIVIPSSIDARIEFVGTDTGNMTYVIEQTVDGKVTGRANFYNIPLSHGGTYSQDISGESLTEENNVILNSKDQTYKPSQYITSDNAEANVGVLCETDKGGVVVGTGIYAKGDPVVLTAYPENDSYKFGGWYINDSLVEMDNVYRFAALDDVVIRAVFKPVREMDEAYIVTMSEDYEESADIHIYKSLNELNDVVISIAGISDIEELKVLVKRYDYNYNRVDDIKIETTYDGVCRFDMPSIDLTGLSKVEIYNEQEQLIGTIKSINAEDENQGNVTPTPDSDSNTPTSSPTQNPNSQSAVSLTPNQSTALPTESSTLSIDTRAIVDKMMYKVTKVNNIGTGEVALIGTTRKKSDKSFTSLKVGDTVKIKGKSFKITAIGNNAFRGYKKLKSVMLEKNVKKIGTKAFYSCKKLKKIVIKTKQLQAKKVGNKAFKGIYSKVNIKVPKPKLKSYKNILRAKGVGKRAKIHTVKHF